MVTLTLWKENMIEIESGVANEESNGKNGKKPWQMAKITIQSGTRIPNLYGYLYKIDLEEFRQYSLDYNCPIY